MRVKIALILPQKNPIFIRNQGRNNSSDRAAAEVYNAAVKRSGNKQHRRKSRTLWLVFLLLLISRRGWVSSVHFNEIDLNELLSSSQYVFVAQKETPFTTTEYVPAVPLVKRIFGLGKKYKSYPVVGHRFTVVEVLVPESKRYDWAEKSIRVHNPNDGVLMNISRNLQLGEPALSPILKSYKENGIEAPASGGRVILFLNAGRKGAFDYAVQGAWETADKREEILNRIKSRAQA
jgi:hypothetical protein